MAIALLYPYGNTDAWVKHFCSCDPDLDISVWPNLDAHKTYEMAIAWNHPPGELSKLNGLRCVASLGAGVEHILADPSLPEDVYITRVVDQALAAEMAEYVVMMTLIQKRQFIAQQEYQRDKRWVKDPDRKQDKVCRVGVLGLGNIGHRTVSALAALGLPVNGWSRTRKVIDHCSCCAGTEELDEFLEKTDVLVCLLPLTGRTENFLNKKLFARLPRGAYIINVGRGRHLVDNDLIEALDTGQLSGACLDVFREEPLPPDHIFWVHPKIIVTCHVSSITNPENVAQQIVQNYHRILQGQSPNFVIDRELGY